MWKIIRLCFENKNIGMILKTKKWYDFENKKNGMIV